MRKQIKRISILLFLASGLISVSAQDSTWFGFGGYIRSGFGLDGNGNSLDVFKAPNAEAKYRLGNEAETYMEALGQFSLKDDNGAVFETNMRIAIVTPTSNSNAFETTFSLREAFVRATGVLKRQKQVSFWAGQRFYDRTEVYMNDYWPRDMTGFGGGVEDIPLGKRVKLAVAFLGGSADKINANGTIKPNNEFSFNKSTIDIKLYDFDIGFGYLGLYNTLSFFNGDVVQTDEGDYYVEDDIGWSIGLYHEKGFEGGRNFIQLFYGSGSAENWRATITQPEGVIPLPGETIHVDGFRRFRVVEDLKVDFSPHFSMLGVLIYQYLDNNMPQNNIINWYSAGVRPVYFFNRYFSLAGEFGWDYTSQIGLESGSLVKMTIAPQITPFNKILTRPVLRAYFTYATWSDAYIGLVAPGSFAEQSQGISFGLQMEVWW
jgi:maltoporin